MKPESLVIAGQHTAVNTFSSLVLTIKARSSAHIQVVKIHFRVKADSRKIAKYREVFGGGSGCKKQPRAKKMN